MTIERYEHHGSLVAVQSDLKGHHREHCLCYQGCANFKPGAPDNCAIAEANLANCKKFGTVQPIWECPSFYGDAIVGPQLIGLCGLAGSGKSTVAEFLAEHGYRRMRFAAPLKNMLRNALAGASVDADVIERMVEGDLKEHPHSALGGNTPRHAMQTLGTQWGRDCMGSDFWVGLAMDEAITALNAGGRVVFEDVRFANEANAIWANAPDGGSEVWMITGRGGISGNHESEGDPSCLNPDVVLHNEGSLEALETHVLEMILG